MKTNGFDVDVGFKRTLFANVLERKLKKPCTVRWIEKSRIGCIATICSKITNRMDNETVYILDHQK